MCYDFPMRLTQYLETTGDNVFSKASGWSKHKIARWRRGVSEPSPQEAWEIERLTKRKVRFIECFEAPESVKSPVYASE